MLGNGLPEALREGDVVRCKWERLKVGLTGADDSISNSSREQLFLIQMMKLPVR